MTRMHGGLLAGPGEIDERLVAQAVLRAVPEGICPDSTVVTAAVAAGLRGDVALVVLRRWVAAGRIKARAGAVVVDHKALARLAEGASEGVVLRPKWPNSTRGDV